MKVEARIFGKGTEEERRMLVLIPTPEESLLIDSVVGSDVGEDGLIASVTGSVRLSDGYGEHYISIEKAAQ